MREPGVFREGDPVLVLVVEGWKRRLYPLVARRGAAYSTFAGVLRGDWIVGAPHGYSGRLGRARYYLLPPTWSEILEHYGVRRSQVVYPKDSGYMVVRAGLRPGSRVFEAGLGSGFLTSVISMAVCPTGVVYGVEARPDMLEAARANLERVGLGDCLVARLGDVRRGVGARGLDAGFLDIPDPWEALDAAYHALRPGGVLVVFVPTMSQLDKLASRVEAHGGFVVEEAVENLQRGVEMVPGAVRPSPRMVGHTGYMVFLRRLSLEEPPDNGEPGDGDEDNV